MDQLQAVDKPHEQGMTQREGFLCNTAGIFLTCIQGHCQDPPGKFPVLNVYKFILKIVCGMPTKRHDLG